jgi:hypothetical protein
MAAAEQSELFERICKGRSYNLPASLLGRPSEIHAPKANAISRARAFRKVREPVEFLLELCIRD